MTEDKDNVSRIFDRPASKTDKDGLDWEKIMKENEKKKKRIEDERKERNRKITRWVKR